MDLIDRYVDAVAAGLPGGSDVPKELHSLLTDTLEGRAAREGRAPDQAMAVDVLREFGSPEAVADRYRGPRFLIGPRLYPMFESIALGIVVITPLVGIVASLFGLLFLGRSFSWLALGNGAWQVIENVFVLVAFATVVFAILERFTDLPGDAPARDADWDPLELLDTQIKTDEEVAPADVQWGMWGCVLMLVLVNVFPHWFGIFWGHQYHYWVVPFSDLGVPVPAALINGFVIGALLMNVLLWRRGRWTRGLRWLELTIGVVAGGIFAVMLAGLGGVSVNADWFAVRGWEPGEQLPAALDAIEKLHRIARGVLWVLLAVQVYQTSKRLWRLVGSSADVAKPVVI